MEDNSDSSNDSIIILNTPAKAVGKTRANTPNKARVSKTKQNDIPSAVNNINKPKPVIKRTSKASQISSDDDSLIFISENTEKSLEKSLPNSKSSSSLPKKKIKQDDKLSDNNFGNTKVIDANSKIDQRKRVSFDNYANLLKNYNGILRADHKSGGNILAQSTPEILISGKSDKTTQKLIKNKAKIDEDKVKSISNENKIESVGNNSEMLKNKAKITADFANLSSTFDKFQPELKKENVKGKELKKEILLNINHKDATGFAKNTQNLNDKKEIKNDKITSQIITNDKIFNDNSNIAILNSKDRSNIKPEVSIDNAQSKYIIKFKSDKFEKTFFVNDSDLMEDIYKDLLGSDLDTKLYYEGMKLSRYLTIEESGFFPGLNYITCKDEKKKPDNENLTVCLRFDDNPRNDLVLNINGKYAISDLINAINKEKLIEITDKMLISNGVVLENSSIISHFLSSGDCIDVVDSKLISK